MKSRLSLMISGLMCLSSLIVAQTPSASPAATSSAKVILLLDGTTLSGKVAGHDETQLYVSSDSGFAKYPLIEIQAESLAKLGVLSKTNTEALWDRIEQLEAALVEARKQTSVQVVGQVLNTNPQVVPEPTPAPNPTPTDSPSITTSTSTTVFSSSGTATPYAPSSGGTVWVSGYYRKDGTYVHGYSRRK